MKLCYCCLLAAAVFSTGCGKEEHRQAVTLCQALDRQRADFVSANIQEKELFVGVRSWADAIVANGGGRAIELDQNAAVAKQLADSAALVSAQLGKARTAVYDLTLDKEYLQGIRTDLIGKITRRQRLLQEVRAALQESQTGFLDFHQVRDYKGDTYPDGIGKLNSLLESYKGPEDSVGEAVTGLKTRYGLKDAELSM